MGRYVVKPDGVNIINGSSQADRTNNVWCSSFKFERKFVICGFFSGYEVNHLPTALVWRKCI